MVLRGRFGKVGWSLQVDSKGRFGMDGEVWVQAGGSRSDLLIAGHISRSLAAQICRSRLATF